MSRKNSVRVGPMTLAVSLVVLGVIWLAQNLTGFPYFSYLSRWWPVLLILLGLEYLWRHSRYSPEVSVRWSVVSLIMIFIISSGLASSAWVPPGTYMRVRDFVTHIDPVSREHSFKLEPISDYSSRTVRIENSSGEVRVRRSSDSSIHISGTMGYAGNGPELNDAVPGRVKAVPGDTILVTAENIEGYRLLRVDYLLEIPSGLNLEVSNNNGEVRVSEVVGNVSVENTNGEVTVKDIKGKVGVRNELGNIRLQSVAGDAALRANLGMIDINDFKGSLSAEVESGEINIRTDKPVYENWNLYTSLGSINVVFPGRSSVLLEASTQLGSVTGSNGINWQSQNGKKVSRLGDGQGSIKMTAQKGGVNVRLND